MKKQDFKVLKTKDLYPFPDNPFHVAEDETLSELAESIKEFGIVTPIITRPKEDGDGYEVIAGQRRVRASELAGINTVPAFVLPLDRDRAIITLVDSNLQRENMQGKVIYDSISELDFYMKDQSELKGAFVDDESYAGNGGDGYCNVYISSDSKWIVTGDSTVTALYSEGTIVDDEGKTVSIVGKDGTKYVSGDSTYTITVEKYETSADFSNASECSSWSDYEVEK